MPLPTVLSRFNRLAGLVLIAPVLLGADGDYLREIEEEAKRQATTLLTSPAASELAPATDTDRLAPGLGQPGFEQALRENLPGTYAFYQRLAPANRQKVYAAYQQDNRLAAISEQIIRLTSGKP
ncbi:MAG: hypothetical protein LAE24_10460 [Candidatus Contendobacter sp.]|jgi:hypothetical protein|nr:hypothetical protein [Candidatus Contendobacter sp.]